MIYSVYGYGKYKTEASIGCAVRAIANNEKVLFVQFLKNGSSSEIEFLKKHVEVLVGEVHKITLPKNITTIDKFNAQSLFIEVVELARDFGYNLIVLDEVLPAIDMELITLEQLEVLIEICEKNSIDLFLTGRIRNKELRLKVSQLSDICTNAYCVKHCFNTHCSKCGKDFPYHYTYCCDCGSELEVSTEPKKGRDY